MTNSFLGDLMEHFLVQVCKQMQTERLKMILDWIKLISLKTQYTDKNIVDFSC